MISAGNIHYELGERVALALHHQHGEADWLA